MIKTTISNFVSILASLYSIKLVERKIFDVKINVILIWHIIPSSRISYVATIKHFRLNIDKEYFTLVKS